MPYTATNLNDVDATKPDGAVEAVSILDDARREIALATKNTVGAEHDLVGGRHKLGAGTTAARNAITNWVVGSVWFNTDVSPAKIQRVVSLGPTTWEDIGDIATFNTHKAGTAASQHTAGVGDHTHQSAGAQGGTLDHGLALTGLADDDHPQYLHLNKAAQTIQQSVAVTAGQTLDGVDLSAHKAGFAASEHDSGVGNHTHQSVGANGGQLDHGLALVGLGDDDHTQYVLRSILTVDGDIFIRSVGAIARLAVGGVAQLLGVTGGLPAWQAQTYIDHGAVSGLADDDHPQYAALSQAEVVTGQWVFDLNIEWKSGTAFKGIFDHANTADRTYTLPDLSAEVAISPVTRLIFCEDFEQDDASGTWLASSNRRARYLWRSTSIALEDPSAAQGQAGRWRFANTTAQSNGAWLTKDGTATMALIFVQPCFLKMRWANRSNDSSGTTDVRRLGLASAELSLSDPSNGIYFRHTGLTGNIIAVCRSGGVESTLDTGIATALGVYHTAEIRVFSSSLAEIFVDGVSKGTIITNIPTTALGIAMGITRVVGNAGEGVDVDYAIVEQSR